MALSAVGPGPSVTVYARAGQRSGMRYDDLGRLTLEQDDSRITLTPDEVRRLRTFINFIFPHLETLS